MTRFKFKLRIFAKSTVIYYIFNVCVFALNVLDEGYKNHYSLSLLISPLLMSLSAAMSSFMAGSITFLT